MIRRLRVANYRSHQDTTVDLAPLTVFIGPVGGGKSNVFRALLLLQRAMSKEPAELFGPPPYDFASHLSRNADAANETLSIEVTLSDLVGFAGTEVDYELDLAILESQPAIVRESMRIHEGRGREQRWAFERGGSTATVEPYGVVSPRDAALLTFARRGMGGESDDAGLAAQVGTELLRQGYFNLEPEDLSRPSPRPDGLQDGGPQRLGYRGANLPATLDYIRETDPGAFAEIRNEMRALLPGLLELRLTPAGLDGLGLSFQFEGHESYLSSMDVSDGTLLTLGLLALVNHPAPPSLLVLEEPEGGIHPGRLRWLIDQLWELAEGLDGRAPTQVLLSTHSPYVLDQFHDAPEAVRVVERFGDGSRIRPLSDVLAELDLDARNIEPDALGRLWYARLLEEP